MANQQDLFSGEGEVRALLRAHDWSGFPIGPPEEWPGPLRATLTLMLDSPLPMRLLWGSELQLLYNDAYIEILGQKHPSALTRPYWEVWPELEQYMRPIIDQTLAGVPAFAENVELQMHRHEHAERAWFTFSFSPLRDEGGSVAGIFATCMETTMRVLSERRQGAASEYLRRLFEQAPGFMAVVRGPEHVYELVNASYLNLVGQRDLVGKTVRDAIPEVEGQGYIDMLDRVLATGARTIGHDFSVKLRRDPDGAPIERFVNFVFQPILAPGGEVTGIFIEGSDVTGQHHAQQELSRLNRELAEKVQHLEEAERRQTFQLELADLLRGSSDSGKILSGASALLGRHLKVCRVLFGEYDAENQRVSYHSNYVDGKVAELTGDYPAASFGLDNFALLERGTTWICNNLALDPSTSGPDAWPTFEAMNIHSGVVVPLNRDGALIASLFINDSKPREWTNEEIRLIEDSAERIWSALERSRAEAALRQADQRKDEFLAMLAHELRNPLAPISAAAELMGFLRLDDAGIKQASDIITRQVRHMTGLVDDLLDVSRVTRGLVHIDKNTQELKGIVANAVEQVRPMMEARRHHLGLHLPPQSVHVVGDAKRLVQILTNLLNNAAKYTPEGGNILLQMEVDAGQVILTVQDDGIGIAPELQVRIFDLFAQAKRSSDRSQGGLGLGLALVKSLVELHGGKVACFSGGIGKGSRFTVCLPRLPEAEDLSDVPRSDADMQMPVDVLRLMVVDDNADAASMLAMFLEAMGHHVVVEHGARRALERARIELPHVCLLDIGLPDVDGHELARRLRAQPETARSVLIAVTGYGQELDRQHALASGFDHHLVKPVDTGKLIALLARITDS